MLGFLLLEQGKLHFPPHSCNSLTALIFSLTYPIPTLTLHQNFSVGWCSASHLISAGDQDTPSNFGRMFLIQRVYNNLC